MIFKYQYYCRENNRKQKLGSHAHTVVWELDPQAELKGPSSAGLASWRLASGRNLA